MSEKKTTQKSMIIIIILAAAAVALAIFGLKVPIGIEANVTNENLYEYEDATRSDLEVHSVTLFKNKKQIHDYEIQNADKKIINITWRTFNKELQTNRIGVKEIVASYDAPAYAYQYPDADSVVVNLFYEDGTKYRVYDLDLSGMQMFSGSKQIYAVPTPYGEATLEIPIIQVKEIEAEYTKPLYTGDTFDSEAVRVKAVYEDDTKVLLEMFDCDYSGTVTEKTEISFTTGMGDGVLVLNPVQVERIEAEYTQPIYEGDVFRKANIEVICTMQDGTQGQITDFQMENERIITDEEELSIETEYGPTEVYIEPIPVVSVVSDIGTAEAGSQVSIHTIIFQYEDGATREINAEDVEFDKSIATKTLEVGNNVFLFKYNNKTYNLIIPAEEGIFAGYTLN